MDTNRGFFEGDDIIWLAMQADADSDVTGDWLKLRDYSRCVFLMSKLGSEDVDDQGIQFLQGTSAAGAGSKALSVPGGSRVFYKTGTLTSQTLWTSTTLSADADGLAFGANVPTGFTRVVADVGTNALLLAVELQQPHLDIDNGFGWCTCFFAGANCNNACLISVQAILRGCRFGGAVPPSSIS